MLSPPKERIDKGRNFGETTSDQLLNILEDQGRKSLKISGKTVSEPVRAKFSEIDIVW